MVIRTGICYGNQVVTVEKGNERGYTDVYDQPLTVVTNISSHPKRTRFSTQTNLGLFRRVTVGEVSLNLRSVLKVYAHHNPPRTLTSPFYRETTQ